VCAIQTDRSNRGNRSIRGRNQTKSAEIIVDTTSFAADAAGITDAAVITVNN
jgi:hypothetical protein